MFQYFQLSEVDTCGTPDGESAQSGVVQQRVSRLRANA